MSELSIFRLIGQNVLVKTATIVENSTVVAVISFLKEDTGWTKRVGKNLCRHCNFNAYMSYIFLRRNISGGRYNEACNLPSLQWCLH